MNESLIAQLAHDCATSDGLIRCYSDGESLFRLRLHDRNSFATVKARCNFCPLCGKQAGQSKEPPAKPAELLSANESGERSIVVQPQAGE